MLDWFEDDITFCASDCNHFNCFRSPKNIKNFRYPHSFADFKNTMYCPFYNCCAKCEMESGGRCYASNTQALDIKLDDPACVLYQKKKENK